MIDTILKLTTPLSCILINPDSYPLHLHSLEYIYHVQLVEAKVLFIFIIQGLHMHGGVVKASAHANNYTVSQKNTPL